MARVGSGAALVAAILFAYPAVSARAAEPPPAAAGTTEAPAGDRPVDVPGPSAPEGDEEIRPQPPPAIRPLPAARAPLAAPVVAPLRESEDPPVKHRYLYQRWPFWAVTGGLVLGMIALTYAATRPPPEPYYGSSVATFVLP